jgi:hypothetical protein
MTWVYIIIYFLGAILTGFCVYSFYVKEYVKTKTALKFKYWIEDKYEMIFISSFFWFCLLFLFIILYPFKKIIKKINKHYNVEY